LDVVDLVDWRQGQAAASAMVDFFCVRFDGSEVPSRRW
jgi:hypothetical protein